MKDRKNNTVFSASPSHLKRETARIGLTINTSKTKYMVAGNQRGFISGGGSEIVLDGEKFEVVEEFVYLGTLATCDNDVTREVKRRIAAANRAYYGLRNQLKSRSLQTKTKLALYTTLILPVALYGHETWTLKEADRKLSEYLSVRCCGQYSAVNRRTASGGVA